MIKRVISVILIIATLFTCVCVSAEETAELSVNENAVKLLEDLKIIYPKIEEQYHSSVTRADFAVYAARALGINDMTDPGDIRYYIDMAMYDYASYSVNCLVERGVLSVGEDRMFRPAEPITYSEAVKIVVCMLGYRPVAETKGGYPIGYNVTASRLDLLDGISENAEQLFTLNDAIAIIYEALIAPLYIVDSITIGPDGSMLGYSSSEDNTLVYEGFGYKYITGILTGYDGMNISFDVTASEGQAVVDNIAYKVEDGLELTDWIGSHISILVDKDNVICYAYQEPKNEKIIQIDIRDFESYDGNSLVYNYNDKGMKTIDVSSAIVLYNGAVPESGTKELFKNLESGTIKVIDFDSDSENDAIVVNDYHAYIYKSANTTKNIIYSKVNGQESLELNAYQKVDMLDNEGNAIDILDLAVDDVLNVLAATDKSRIKIIVTNEAVSGMVGSVWKSIPFECTINDSRYAVNNAHSSIQDKINPGQTATFLLNQFGEIVMVVDGVRGDYQVGFLCGIAIDGVFNKQLRFRVYTKNNGIEVFESGEKIRIDGIKYTDAATAACNIPDTSCSGNSVASFKSQMILFKTDTDGYVTDIDTHNVSSHEDPDITLARVTDGTAKLQKLEGRLGTTYPINAATDFYCVPVESELGSDDDNYKVVKQGVFNRTVSFPFECYKTMGKNEFVDVVLYHMNPEDNSTNDWLNSNMFLVKEKTHAIDENMNIYTQIYGLMQGGDRSIDVYDDQLIHTSISLSDIDEGDLIRYRTGQTGKIIEIEKLYDVSDNQRIDWNNDTSTHSLYDQTYAQIFQLSFGYVNKRGESTVSWGYKTGAEIDEIMDLSTIKCMYYDPTLRQGTRFYTGSLDAIADYETASDRCDIIIVQMKQSVVQGVVIYKRQ